MLTNHLLILTNYWLRMTKTEYAVDWLNIGQLDNEKI